MSSFDDNPDEHKARLPHKTLLPLELNPLTSPLLSQNMGRWAEVYFTSPPEKREQAIQELLRELGGDPASAGNPVSEDTAGEQGSSAGDDAAASVAASGPVPWSTIVAATNGAQEVAPEPASDTDRLLAPIEPSTDGALGWARSDQQVAADPSRLFLDHPSTHRRNRVLTTAALAILVGTLFYVGWRETTAWLRIHAAPSSPALRSAAPETRSATARPSPAAAAVTGTSGAGGTVGGAAGVDRAASSTQNGSSSSKPDTGANSATASSPQKELPPRNPADEKPNQAPPNLTPPIQALANQPTQNQTARNPGSGSPGSGTDELAEAESYLNGTDGKPQDSGEAAKWLWKSVAKQNAVAAMLLSDLYVRGEGVPKNCDQARLLLDAAARKGVPGAGERIRNLPNVGCP